ncbi:MAG: hypothetical protein IPH77_14990 [Ignavibacteria bacterium]|nr:hypothetical protein [Ignavibacteria bacterium]
MISDTVTVNLRDTISPFKLVDTYKTILNPSGTKTFIFPNALKGKKYYLQVRYRNSLGIWSTLTAAFAGGSLSYNFSTAITQD